jgi:hypothetical protein
MTNIVPLRAPVGPLVTTVDPMPGDHCNVMTVLSGKFWPLNCVTIPGGPMPGLTVNTGEPGGGGGLGVVVVGSVVVGLVVVVVGCVVVVGRVVTVVGAAVVAVVEGRVVIVGIVGGGGGGFVMAMPTAACALGSARLDAVWPVKSTGNEAKAGGTDVPAPSVSTTVAV